MDSRSRRLPFCLPSSRPSYTSSPTVSSPSLGCSRLYSRDTVLNNDRFPRTSSAYKADLDRQSSRLLSSTRDYGSAASRSASWKLPSSLTSSSRSSDRPRAEPSLGSGSKLTDPEGRLGMRSGLLNVTDDGDTKRAKLSYNNRLYSRTAGSSVTGSTYSSAGLSRVEKPKDACDSPWSSCRFLSRSAASSSSSSSNPLLSRRELDTRNKPSLSDLGERRGRTPGSSSSLYQTDRVTSTYAQGARPKETAYYPSFSSSYSSSSSAARESTLNRHLSSSTSYRSPPLVRDFRTPSRFPSGSSALHSSGDQPRSPESSWSISSPYSSHTSRYAAPPPRPESALPPRPVPEGGEHEGRSSTRRLLSRLFSRRSSQDSSSGSSSVRSLDDDSPSTGGESVDGDEGARVSSVEADARGSAAALGSLRSRRADLAPIQENNNGYRRGLAQTRTPSWREPGVGSSHSSSGGGRGGRGGGDAVGGGGGSSYSWLSSSLRGRCPPLLSRLRRHRDESAHSAASAEEGHGRPRHSLRRWDDLEHKATQEDDDEDEEEEDDDEGAVGRPCRLEDETLPEEASVAFSPRRRVGVEDNIGGSVAPLAESQLEKPGTDQEKLRMIKERLLLEDSDEDEGDLCRICQMGQDSASNPLIQPCRCAGSLLHVHQDCIKRWLRSKIGSGTNLEAITTCELCKEKLHLNIDNFDIQELYRTHVQSEYDEFISSGLYLVVLLHFCEQRFSDVLGAVDAAGFPTAKVTRRCETTDRLLSSLTWTTISKRSTNYVKVVD
ncbi:E3 ubiquitin-protein ligase MARCH7 isoform X2 [Pseudoliparis swirei]|uniref:E3 ubiquitin-protein ligase MARCH7 isoform X2 n=1 Tax=Pseudoliparis swirei TaxID=2059687 RepID=UPI0024BF060A|nr:E3 ubiquitin-protein ligase MARCH7 isoform X2 [Pseudoliparis swirei]